MGLYVYTGQSLWDLFVITCISRLLCFPTTCDAVVFRGRGGRFCSIYFKGHVIWNIGKIFIREFRRGRFLRMCSRVGFALRTGMLLVSTFHGVAPCQVLLRRCRWSAGVRTVGHSYAWLASLCGREEAIWWQGWQADILGPWRVSGREERIKQAQSVIWFKQNK